MPREFEYEGKVFEFPYDVDVNTAILSIRELTKPPTMGEVVEGLPQTILGGLQQQAGGLVRGAGDLFRSETLSEVGRGIAESGAINAQLAVPRQEYMTFPQRMVQSGVTSAAEMLPWLVGGPIAGAARMARGATAAEAAAGVAGLATTQMGISTAAREYNLNREAGIPGGRAALHSAFAGAVEKYTEYYPAKWLFGSDRAIKSFLLEFLGKEFAGEEIATVLQHFNAKVSHSPNLTLKDLAEDMLVTAGSLGVSAPIQAGVAKGMQAAMSPFLPDQPQQGLPLQYQPTGQPPSTAPVTRTVPVEHLGQKKTLTMHADGSADLDGVQVVASTEAVQTAAAVAATTPATAPATTPTAAATPGTAPAAELATTPATPPEAGTSVAGLLSIPKQHQSAATVPATPTSDDLHELASNLGAPKPELLRLYAVIPMEATLSTLPQDIIYTASVVVAQGQLDTLNGLGKVVYYDMTPKAAQNLDSQRQQSPLQAQKTDPKTDFVLPSVYAQNGSALYTPTPTSAATPARAVDTDDLSLRRLEGAEDFSPFDPDSQFTPQEEALLRSNGVDPGTIHIIETREEYSEHYQRYGPPNSFGATVQEALNGQKAIFVDDETGQNVAMWLGPRAESSRDSFNTQGLKILPIRGNKEDFISTSAFRRLVASIPEGVTRFVDAMSGSGVYASALKVATGRDTPATRVDLSAPRIEVLREIQRDAGGFQNRVMTRARQLRGATNTQVIKALSEGTVRGNPVDYYLAQSVSIYGQPADQSLSLASNYKKTLENISDGIVSPAILKGQEMLRGDDLFRGDGWDALRSAEPGQLVVVDPPYFGSRGYLNRATPTMENAVKDMEKVGDAARKGVHVVYHNAYSPSLVEAAREQGLHVDYYQRPGSTGGQEIVVTSFPVEGIAARGPGEMRTRALTPEQKRAYETPVAEGAVVIAPNVNTTPYINFQAQFVHKWIKVFSPKMRVLIVGEDTRRKSDGGTEQREDGVHILTLPRNVNLHGNQRDRLTTTFLLAHEFGHMLVRQHLYAAPFEIRVRLHDEHEALVREVGNMKAKEFLQRWAGPHRIYAWKEILKGYGVAENAPALDLVEAINNYMGRGDYALSFSEYAAEQFSRYVATRDTVSFPEDSGLRKWWNELYQTARDFFDKVVLKLQVPVEFQKWIDSMAATSALDGYGLPISAVGVYEGEAFTPNESDASRQEYESVVAKLNEITYTTAAIQRVFARFPDKTQIRKTWITDELTRQGVKKAEKDFFVGYKREDGTTVEGFLDDFPEPVIDVNKFMEALQAKLFPLALKPTLKYNDYGWHSQSDNLAKLFGPRVTPEYLSIIFEAPFPLGEPPHFSDITPNYFAHQRVAIHNNEVAVGELQSDIMQRLRNIPEAEAKDAREQASSAENLMDKVKRALHTVRSSPQVHVWNFDHTPFLSAQEYLDAISLAANEPNPVHPKVASFLGDLYKEHQGRVPEPQLGQFMETKLKAYKDEMNGKWRNSDTYLKDEIERAENKVKDAAGTLADQHETLARIKQPLLKGLHEEKLQKNIKDLADAKNKLVERQKVLEMRNVLRRMIPYYKQMLIRRIMSSFAKLGYDKVHFADAKAVAKIESWTAISDHSSWGFDTIAENDPEFKKFEGGEPAGWSFRRNVTTALQSLVRQTTKGFEGMKNDHPARSYYLKLQEAFANGADVGGDIPIIVKPEHAGIFLSYQRDIEPFLQSLGATETTVNPKTGERYWTLDISDKDKLPTEYFHPSENLGGVGTVMGDDVIKSDDPHFSAAFQRAQGMFNVMLQLNQMAKLLPTFEPLQLYRRAMQSLNGLKFRLLEGPNDTYKAWDRISKQQDNLVSRAMRDEVNDGVHWTSLVSSVQMVNNAPKEIWTHMPSPKFQEEMTNRGINEQAAEVILRNKNDLLFTLTSMEEMLNRSVDAHFVQNPLAASLRKGAIKAEFDTLRNKPYLPSHWFGKWSVYIHSGVETVVEGRVIKKGELIYRASFEKQDGQRKHFAEMKRSYGADHRVSLGYEEENVHALRGLPANFLQELGQVLELDAVQMEQLRQLHYDFTKEGAFAKMLGKEKKYVGGASGDLRRSLSLYHWKAANHISKLRYNRDLQRALRQVKTAGNNMENKVPYQRLHEYLSKNYNYVMQPQNEWQQLKAFVALWYLWASPKTAMVNFTSVVTLTYPYLAARYGDVQSVTAMVRAIKDVVRYWKDPTSLPEDKQRVLQQAREDGVTDQSFPAEMAGLSDGNALERILPTWNFLQNSGLSETARRTTRRIINMGMAPFRVIEQINRQVTLMAAYDLESAKTGKKFATGDLSSYYTARDAVDYTQVEFGAWNKPPFLQGKKGTLLIFFTFVQNAAFFLFGGDKGWWRAMFVLMALSGIQGLPGAENLIDMLNWAWRRISGEHVDLRIEAREYARTIGLNPDLMMHGITHDIFGWNASGSIGLGRLVPATDAIFGEGDFEKRFVRAASEVGGPASSLMMSMLQAVADDNPNTMMRLDRVLPPALRNLERTYRYAQEGVKTREGATLVEEVSPGQLVGTALGFQPTEVAAKYEVIRIQREVAEYYIGRRENLLAMWYQAKRSGDGDVIGDVKDRLAEYNDSVPDKQLRITARELLQSWQARERFRKDVEADRAPVKRYQQRYQEVSDLFGG